MGIIICRDIQLLKVVNKVVESTVNLTRKFNLDYSCCISPPLIDVTEKRCHCILIYLFYLDFLLFSALFDDPVLISDRFLSLLNWLWVNVMAPA